MACGVVGKAFTATGQVVAAGGPVQSVAGLSVLDTSGSANVVSVYDGTSSSGTLIGSVSVGANGVAVLDFSLPRQAAGGLYVNCTGAVKATLWLA